MEAVEAVSEAIHDFLDQRFPDGAMPGGKQLFADDHLDAEFKHEAGCDAMAEFIMERLAAYEANPTEIAPLKPRDGNHEADCNYRYADIWICECRGKLPQPQPPSEIEELRP